VAWIIFVATNVINFSFPLSNISIRPYLVGTAIGLIPETLLNVVTGYLIKHEVILLSAPETRTWQALVIGVLRAIKHFRKYRIVRGISPPGRLTGTAHRDNSWGRPSWADREHQF